VTGVVALAAIGTSGAKPPAHAPKGQTKNKNTEPDHAHTDMMKELHAEKKATSKTPCVHKLIVGKAAAPRLTDGAM
jgi:hypothetical protein